MTTRTVANPIVLALLLTLSLGRAAPASDPAVPVYEEPPTPEELADLLYGPRYRSVADEPVSRSFGMMINFEFDSTVVLPESLPMLDSVGQMLDLATARNEVLVIEGHTDASGTERYNHNLSMRRARAIKDYLVAGYQVDADRLVTVGQGEADLYVPDDPEHPINRRVVFRSLDSVVIQ